MNSIEPMTRQTALEIYTLLQKLSIPERVAALALATGTTLHTDVPAQEHGSTLELMKGAIGTILAGHTAQHPAEAQPPAAEPAPPGSVVSLSQKRPKR